MLGYLAKETPAAGVCYCLYLPKRPEMMWNSWLHKFRQLFQHPCMWNPWANVSYPFERAAPSFDWMPAQHSTPHHRQVVPLDNQSDNVYDVYHVHDGLIQHLIFCCMGGCESTKQQHLPIRLILNIPENISNAKTDKINVWSFLIQILFRFLWLTLSLSLSPPIQYFDIRFACQPGRYRTKIDSFIISSYIVLSNSVDYE